MYSIEFFRDNYEVLKRTVALKDLQVDVDYLYQLSLDRAKISKQVEMLKKRQHRLNRKFMSLLEQGENADALHTKLKELANRLKHLRKKLKTVNQSVNQLLLALPNLPHASVPQEINAQDVIIKEWFPEDPRQMAQRTVRPHYEIAEAYRMYDQRYTKKISATKFLLYLPRGSAVVNHLLQTLSDFWNQHSFSRIFVPVVLERRIVKLSGFLHADEDMYLLKSDSLQLSPSGHIGILNLLANLTLQESELPLRLFTLANCYRKNIGSYGKENRGLLRMRQFIKSDCLIVTDPASSYEVMERFLALFENLIRCFSFPYRIISLCYRNTPFPAAKTYRMEAYLPSLKKFINIVSLSNSEDFLAKRIKLKMRSQISQKKDTPHILIGTGPSIERLLVLLMEYKQRADGSLDLETIYGNSPCLKA